MANSAIPLDDGKSVTSLSGRGYRRRLLLAVVGSCLLHMLMAGGLVATKLGILTSTPANAPASPVPLKPKLSADYELEAPRSRAAGKPIHEKPLEIELKADTAQAAAKKTPTAEFNRSISREEAKELTETTAAASAALARTLSAKEAILEKAAELARQKLESQTAASPTTADTSVIQPAADTAAAPAAKPAMITASQQSAESVSAASAAPKEVALITKTLPQIERSATQSQPTPAESLVPIPQEARREMTAAGPSTVAQAEAVSSLPSQTLPTKAPVAQLKPQRRADPATREGQSADRSSRVTIPNPSSAIETTGPADPTASASRGDWQTLAQTSRADSRRANAQTQALTEPTAAKSSPAAILRQGVGREAAAATATTQIDVASGGAAAAAAAQKAASGAQTGTPTARPALRAAQPARSGGGSTALGQQAPTGEATDIPQQAAAGVARLSPPSPNRSAREGAAQNAAGDASGLAGPSSPRRTALAANEKSPAGESGSRADALPAGPPRAAATDQSANEGVSQSAALKPAARLARNTTGTVGTADWQTSALVPSQATLEGSDDLSSEVMIGDGGSQAGLAIGSPRRNRDATEAGVAPVVEPIHLPRALIVVLPVEGRVREIAKPFEKRDQKKRVVSTSDATVERGLMFLVQAQQQDGRWSLGRFPGATQKDVPKLQSDTAATGLALLSFMGAGYDHFDGKRRDTVRRGLEFLLSVQKPDGDLYITSDKLSDSCSWLYSHGIATMALCEAVGMTGDPIVRPAAEKACGFIVASQHPLLGGWRYTPASDADLSVSGWMLVALRSGQLAGIPIEPKALDLVRGLLDASTVAAPTSPQAAAAPAALSYLYNARKADQRPSQSSSLCMVALGTLMRLHTGWNKSDPRVIESGRVLTAVLPTFGTKDQKSRDCYLWYYVSQVLVHTGGDNWQKWYDALAKQLAATQETTGSKAGSWDPLGATPDRWGAFGGRLYVTTLHLLTLEVPYRHLPTYSLSEGQPTQSPE